MDLSLEKPRGHMVMEINVVCLSTERHRQDNPLQHWFPSTLKFISEADNDGVMNRSVQCQCRQQSYSKLPDPALTFWPGYQPDHCSLGLFSLFWDLNLPFLLHRWKRTKWHQAQAVPQPAQGKENVPKGPKLPKLQGILQHRAAKTITRGETVCMSPLSLLIQAWQESCSAEQFICRLERFTDLIKHRAFFNEEKMLPNSSP